MVDLSKGWISKTMPPAERGSGSVGDGVLRQREDRANGGGAFLQRGFHITYFNIGSYWHETERIPVCRAGVEEEGGNLHEIEYSGISQPVRRLRSPTGARPSNG